MDQTPRWRTLLELVTTMVLLAAGITMLWGQMGPRTPPEPPIRPDPAIPADLQPLANAQVRGRVQAPVAMVIYSDFECPFCGRFARDIFGEIDRAYIQTGKVLVAFRHSPIERIHPRAVKASEAAECAARQGRFWDMHDALFAPGATLDFPGLLDAAKVAGIDVGSMEACLKEDGSARIRADRAAAEALGLTGTPAFLIGTLEPGGVRVAKVLRGAKPFNEFAAAIDDLLARVGA